VSFVGNGGSFFGERPPAALEHTHSTRAPSQPHFGFTLLEFQVPPAPKRKMGLQNRVTNAFRLWVFGAQRRRKIEKYPKMGFAGPPKIEKTRSAYC
jgi:hypothetical protein